MPHPLIPSPAGEGVVLKKTSLQKCEDVFVFTL